MPLQKSRGNMYPWVTHTHSHLGGKCPHGCTYCYVDNPRFGRPQKYTGPLCLLENEFGVKYGWDKTIFLENCNDLFAESVPEEWINRILCHARCWPDNTYVLQTKNPERFMEFYEAIPESALCGTTLESTHRHPCMGSAPHPIMRMEGIGEFNHMVDSVFITIEPILKLEVNLMLGWIKKLRPAFVNIGADSKGRGLLEPSPEEVKALIDGLTSFGIEVRQKSNLSRLLNQTR